jgi:CRISPR/Cas system endoribonuclease Cas6 (RAMP superfamily)
MLYQLSHLREEEIALVMDVPVWVSIFVALSDNDITVEERRKIVETVHTKTFSEKNDLSVLYKELEADLSERIDRAIRSIPVNQEEKAPYVTEKLVAFNKVLQKLDKTFAKQLYKSLKEFAVYTAQASGGIIGINKIGTKEKKFAALEMIQEP